MKFNTYLIYYLISCLIFVIYTLLYIEKERKQTGKGRANGQTVQEDGEPGQRLVLSVILTASSSSPSSSILQVVRADSAKEQEEWKEEREPGRRIPPTSSPVPRISSVPSAASTVHTIASGHLLTLSQKEREGRPPRPLLGDVIATDRKSVV